jgi:putative transposase
MPHLSVRKLCRSLGVNRQWYYQHRCPSAHQESDQRLRAARQEIREAFAGYGSRRVTKALVRAGWKVNHKRIWRVMRQAGLTYRRKRRTIHTTDSKQSYQVYPNLVKGLQVEAPNRFWVADSRVCAVTGRLCVPGLHSRRLLT